MTSHETHTDHHGDHGSGTGKRPGPLTLVFFAVLLVAVGLNLFIRPHEPHFGLDSYPGFWAIFGLGVGLLMIFVMKRIIQPLIVRNEDYYGDL